MSLEQKATLLTASGGWNKIVAADASVSALAFSSGAYGLKTGKGLRFYGAPATRFPSPLSMARSWNTQLNACVANCIGNEARSLGINVLNAPESAVFTGEAKNSRYSEDPYLAGKMLAAYVKGVQNNGIMAAVEYADGASLASFASDEKTLREIALTPAEMAVKDGGAKCVRIPTSRSGENRHLLGGILKTEWQYDGMVVAADGGDMNVSRALSLGTDMLEASVASEEAQKIVKAVNNYKAILTDIECGQAKEEKLGEAISNGEAISEELVDMALERLLGFVDACAVEANEGGSYSSYPVNHTVMFDEKAHAKQSVNAACECAVLLKNTNGLLPLSTDAKVVFIGEYVYRSLATAQDPDFVALDVQTTETLLKSSGLNVTGACRGYSRSAGNSEAAALRAEAAKLASSADVAVVYIGGFDKDGGISEAQAELLRAIRAYPTVKIVGVYIGAGLGDTSWDSLCDAVLCAGDLGQGGAEAIIKLLKGEACPSGKLTETVLDGSVRKMGGEMYGYRMCAVHNLEEKYPFGFGLSYTQFEYSGIRVSRGGVGFKIKNVGDCAGAEVAQLYVGKENSKASSLKRELKGFVKVFLAPGESRFVEIPFDSRTFRYYNTDTQDFETEGGVYQIFVSSSARKIELADEIEIDGSGAAVPEKTSAQNVSVGESVANKQVVKKASVAKLVVSGVISAFIIVAAIAYFAFLREAIVDILNISSRDELAVDVAAIIAGAAALAVSAVMLVLGLPKSKKLKDGAIGIIISSFDSYKPDARYPDDADKFELETQSFEYTAQNTYQKPSTEAAATVAEVGESVENAPVSSKYRVVKHSSFETLEAGCSKLFAAFERYVGVRGISATKEELASLMASVCASRIVTLRTDNVSSALSVLDCFAKSFDARIHSVTASAEDKSIGDALYSKDGSAGIEDALRAAALAPDKMNIILVSGSKTRDVCEYLGDIVRYTGTVSVDFEARFERKVMIPSNVWFVVAVGAKANVETGDTCIVRLDADNSGIREIEDAKVAGGSDVLDVYTVSCGAVTDIITRERENSYLSEKYWRKIDKLEGYISSKIDFKLSNRALNAMEKYVSVCISAGAEEEEALDSVTAALMLGRIRAESAPAFVGDETLSEVMDQVFGADKDDRCRELVKLKGIK